MISHILSQANICSPSRFTKSLAKYRRIPANLRLTGNCWCCYSARVCFVFGLGLFATLWIEGANVIWWHYPTSHSIFSGAYNVIAWLLAGLVIGAIVKKRGAGNEGE